MIHPLCLLLLLVALGDSEAEWTDACGVATSCFAAPEGCLAEDNCVAIVSVAKSEESNLFTFEMESVGGAYVAVGVSKDSNMGDTSVVECIHDEADGGSVKLFMSYNLPGVHSNKRISTVDGVTFVNGSFVDGRVHCSFTRAATTDVEGNLYDLDNEEYHLLLAVGSRVSSSSPPKLAYHNIIRAASKQPRNLGDVGMFV